MSKQGRNIAVDMINLSALSALRLDFDTLYCSFEWGREGNGRISRKIFCQNANPDIKYHEMKRSNIFFYCRPPGRYSGAPDPTLRTAGLIKF